MLVVISLSGGVDSFATALKALEEGHDLAILNFNYGQKHQVEIIAYREIVRFLRANFPGRIVLEKEINLLPIIKEFASLWSRMRDSNELKEKAFHQFYMPSRNLLFSVISAVVGEILYLDTNEYSGIRIALGIHKHTANAYGKEHVDYWDITPEFAERLSDLLRLNDVVDVSLFTPFVNENKSTIIEYMQEQSRIFNQKLLSITWTCYNPQELDSSYIECSKCEACREKLLAGGYINVIRKDKI